MEASGFLRATSDSSKSIPIFQPQLEDVYMTSEFMKNISYPNVMYVSQSTVQDAKLSLYVVILFHYSSKSSVYCTVKHCPGGFPNACQLGFAHYARHARPRSVCSLSDEVIPRDLCMSSENYLQGG